MNIMVHMLHACQWYEPSQSMQIAKYVRMDLRMDSRYDLRYAFRMDIPTMERRTYEYKTLTFLCSLP